jgi:hypothetical protein
MAATPPLPSDDQLSFIQLATTTVLARVARGELDLKALARRELANRGCDPSGQWVGLERARRALAEVA